MGKVWDLIYVSDGDKRTMSLAILDGENAEMVGPFDAKSAGPLIVQALIDNNLEAPKNAEISYIGAHFRNMSKGQNRSGQDYPFKVPTALTNEIRTNGDG
ncbi:hypothetical protein OEG84_19175 [Hoeflea sp. G2-23]|uniref:Uncharacterized protein n=1 Tax=Hoeflea algicola TaxID=2983763 RepID=A0ABT3ZDA6_9HYPH|nr:hypothetical protein [Hoeflea algicola]MCY0149771.1 hypothetical protein [Hoeflea algicola]